MPFGDLLNCFKKNLADAAEEYGGEAARDLVEDGIEQITANQNEAGANGSGGLDVDTLLQSFTGKQQGGLTDLFGSLAGFPFRLHGLFGSGVPGGVVRF